MFEIDQETLMAAKQAVRERYIQKKLKEYSHQYPNRFACAGEAKFREFIEMSLEKAEKYNMIAEREVNGIAILMYHFGSGFDEDPLFPWARFRRFPDKDPDDKSPESFKCLQHVFDQFEIFSGKTLGEDFVYVERSLEHVRRLSFNDILQLRSDADILNMIYRIYPERYLAFDENNLRGPLLRAAKEKAAIYNFDQRTGKALFAALLFTCGIDADTDPLNAAIMRDTDKINFNGLQKERNFMLHLKSLAAMNLRVLRTGNEEDKA